ncbi:MAG: enoyl-CoA hydratase/isomerase family protein, partial [Planctomycetota bacterium]
MDYEGYQTFQAEQHNGVLTVTIDFPPVNLQGQEMLADLNMLCLRLERDRSVKVVVFQSAHPVFGVCHYYTNLRTAWPSEAVSRDEPTLLYLQSTLERVSKLPQTSIAKLEGFARGGGHEFALACDMRFAARG